MRGNGLVVVLLTLCLGALCGCAPAQQPPMESDRSQFSAPAGGFTAQVVVSGTEGVTVTWIDDSAKLIITTEGSSSCPLVPLRLDGEDQDTIVLGRDDGGNDVCSADLGPTSSTITRPKSWDPGIQIVGTYTDTELYLTPSR